MSSNLLGGLGFRALERVGISGAKGETRIPEDMRVYAIGDVDGRADLLQQMFSAIDSILRTDPINNTVQVLLVDYVDRGPNSP
jgi:hypothetical protein